MLKIGESELFINNRGAVYHLNLIPEEIADTIITVGDPNRVKNVSQYFDQIVHTSSHREFITHTGRIGNKKITVLSTGIGTDNIDIVLNELDALANIDLVERKERKERKSLNIIRLGTSGTIQEYIPVDSFVVSTHAIGMDNLMHFYPFVNTDEEREISRAFSAHTHLQGNLSTPYVFGASAFMLAKFAGNAHAGITVSCPGFFGPQGRVLRAGLSMPNFIDELTTFSLGNHRVLNLEMETSGIYGMSKILGHQSISISLVIANRIRNVFSSSIEVMMDTLIKQTLENISH